MALKYNATIEAMPRGCKYITYTTLNKWCKSMEEANAFLRKHIPIVEKREKVVSVHVAHHGIDWID